MLEDKLYTLQELVTLTRLTDRTLRNYLANGTLKGIKVGGQWRFSKEDVKALFRNDTFYVDRKDKANAIVKDFIEQKISFNCKHSACIIVDIKNTTKEERKEFFKNLENINKDNEVKEKVSFIDKNGHVRINIVGSLKYIKDVISLLKEE